MRFKYSGVVHYSILAFGREIWRKVLLRARETLSSGDHVTYDEFITIVRSAYLRCRRDFLINRSIMEDEYFYELWKEQNKFDEL